MAVEYGSLPFEEQLKFFKDKAQNLIPTEKWTDVWKDAHDSGFMVAGAMKADLLADLHGAVLSGIEQGTTIAQFRKDFKEIVARHGWTGWTGEGTKAGEAWRTRVIYDTNMYSSYAAGRYAQATDPEIVDRRPYWRYRHNDSVTTPRPLHVSWNGLVLRHDDPWWSSHFPPNGWGCKCYFETLRKVPDGARTQAPDDGEYVWRGETIPKGIDPGWDYTPGQSILPHNLEVWGEKITRLERNLAVNALHELVDSEVFRRWFDQPQGGFPLVLLTDMDAVAIGAQNGLGVLSSENALKQRRAHPDMTPDDYAAAQRVIDGFSNKVQDSPRSLIYILEVPDQRSGGYVLVVKATKTGKTVFVTSYRRLSRRQAERDKEINRLLAKGKK